MTALPEHPTERDRERFRDITKAMHLGLEYDRQLTSNGDYTDPQTAAMFRLWWSVERERQLLQNLNMSQGCKLSELAQELESERKRLDWALKYEAVFYEWNGEMFIASEYRDKYGANTFPALNPRTTIDKLIAGESK